MLAEESHDQDPTDTTEHKVRLTGSEGSVRSVKLHTPKVRQRCCTWRGASNVSTDEPAPPARARRRRSHLFHNWQLASSGQSRTNETWTTELLDDHARSQYQQSASGFDGGNLIKPLRMDIAGFACDISKWLLRTPWRATAHTVSR